MKGAAYVYSIASILISTVVIAQKPFEKRANCLERAGIVVPMLQQYNQTPTPTASTKIATQPFTPDSIIYESSFELGNPLTITSSAKFSYDAQNRPVFSIHYGHNAAGISIYGTRNITFGLNNRLLKYTFLVADPAQTSYEIEQRFDAGNRLTSQKSYFLMNNQFQLVSGDSLQYILQNGQLTGLIRRNFDFQGQSWNNFERFTNIQLDPSNQYVSAYRHEVWDSSSLSWQNEGDFKSLEWELYYEGHHQIAQMYVFSFGERPFNLPSYQAVTMPMPSRMVYGFENGLDFDTLWHFQPSYTAGSLIRVERDEFVNGSRQAVDRIVYGYDGFGLRSWELLERSLSGAWIPYKKIENTRDQQLNISMRIDSMWYGGTDSRIGLETLTYQYDSLASGQLSQFTELSTMDATQTPSIYRLRFLYSGMSADVGESAKMQILLYPNPVSEGLMVAGIDAPGTLRCFDVAGKLIFEVALNSDSQWVDWRGIKPGLYVVNIQMAGQSKSTRIVKTN